MEASARDIGMDGADAMIAARRKVRTLAREGRTVGEITSSVDADLDEIEREYVWRMAVEETRSARRERWWSVPPLGPCEESALWGQSSRRPFRSARA